MRREKKPSNSKLQITVTPETEDSLHAIAERFGTKSSAIARQILEATRGMKADNFHRSLAELQKTATE